MSCPALKAAGPTLAVYLSGRVTGGDGCLRDWLFDLKLIHYSASRYDRGRVLQQGAASCALRRAEAVHGDYVRAARRLDAAHHAHIPDPDARPVLRRLLGVYVHVLGLSFGAFAEADPMVHTLLRHTADAAAARFWREAGSPSALAARALYISIYRRRWGCEAALQGARLRLARSYLVGSQAQAGGAAFGDSADAFGAGFDPSREADVAAAGAPTLGGVPAGQRG